MKTNKQLLTIATLALFAIMFWASSTPKDVATGEKAISREDSTSESQIAINREVKYSDFSKKPAIENGQISSYVYKDGYTYHVGDTLVLCQTSMSGSNMYAYVREYIPLLLNDQLNISNAGGELVIKELRLEGSSKYGYSVIAICDGIFGDIHISTLEQALNSKEVKLKSTTTSEEAIEFLKNAKDKLELGIITQREYDSLIIVYKKYIK